MLDFLFGKIMAAERDPSDFIKTLTEIAPFIILAAIWIFGAIVKAAQGAKKDQQGLASPKTQKRQPDFNDLLKMVRQRYASVKEQAQKAAQQQAAFFETTVPAPQYKPPSPPYTPKPATPAPAKPKSAPVEEVPLAPELSVNDLSYEQLQPSATQAPQDEHIILVHHPYWEELSQEFKHPDTLRKMILYTEILGTPVGLRD
jgi:hypothetical protein